MGMASKRNWKVIIVGGSIAGLSFASMLEKLGIDFVLLEAYDEIAPQVGASIGLLGNGLRILDQLGCYEELCKHAPDCFKSSKLRSSEGVLIHHQSLDHIIRDRLGYPFIFLDRQTLLNVLYNNIDQKSKILTSKRAIDVQLLTSGVKVTTKDGSEYSGDIVVGADGIHSTVRQKMWEIANKLQGGYFPQDEQNKITCKFACIFGISNPTGMWKGGDTSSIFQEQFSYFIAGGPGGRVYWFLFFSIGDVKTGNDIPRFTKKDEERIAKEHWNDVVDDGVTFGDLYTTRKIAVLTSIEEVVFTKWHFRRIMTIGDAAHKLLPLSAQGGNSAIETAAALANGLANKMKIKTECSESDLEEVFNEVTKLRRQRVMKLMRQAHKRHRVEVLDGRFQRLLALHVLPRLSKEIIFDRLYADISPANKLENFVVPRRPKQAPFDDELPKKTQSTTRTFPLIAVSFLILAVLASNILQQVPHPSKETQETNFNAFSNPLTNSTTTAGYLSAIPLTGEQRLHYFYYTAMLLPFISIWIAEVTSRGDIWSYFFLTLSFLLCQRHGFSKVAPFIYIVTLYKSRKIRALLPLGRKLPASGRTILPAVLLGYSVPTVLRMLLLRVQEPRSIGIILCEAWPIYVGIIAASFSWIFGNAETKVTAPTKVHSNTWHDKVYVVTFLISSTAHIVTILLSLTSQTVSTRDLLISSNSHKIPLAFQGRENYNFGIAQRDMLMFILESILWLILRAWMLIQTGIVDLSWPRASILIVIGSLLVGPGAVASLVWGWQDSALIRILDSI